MAPTSFFTDWAAENAAAPAPAAAPEPTPPPVRTRRSLRQKLAGGGVVAALAASVAAAIVLPASQALADPSSNTWYRLRMCESSDNYSINTGNGHYGAYQFDLSTWRSVGGSGYPYQASPAEQDKRALILYRERGWQPWQCASILGLKEDSDAGSGKIGDILSGTPSSPTHGTPPPSGSAPAFPGWSSYSYGDNNWVIKKFQDQMHARGYFPPGTGQYGPMTLAMVKRLQLMNGLTGSGLLGPKTWAAAYTGTYSLPSTASAATVPAFPNTVSYQYGDWSLAIKRFQDQMHARGVFPAGTGQYGPLTLAMVKSLQKQNGITASGYLGPKTWAAAWTGVYKK